MKSEIHGIVGEIHGLKNWRNIPNGWIICEILQIIHQIDGIRPSPRCGLIFFVQVHGPFQVEFVKFLVKLVPSEIHVILAAIHRILDGICEFRDA